MNYDDLKKAWDKQRFDPASALPDALLESARAAERRFQRLLFVAAFRDATVLIFIVWNKIAHWQHTRVPPAMLPTMVAIVFIGTAIILRYSDSILQNLVGGVGTLAARVDRDSSRFRRLILWRNWREGLLGALMVNGLASKTSDAAGPAAWLWAAAACFALAVTLWIYRTVRISTDRPKIDSTLTGQLTLSAYYTRSQMTFMGHLGGYLFLACLAAACIRMQAFHAGRGTVASTAASLIAAALLTYGAFRLNRWIAETRLRPRLEHLEHLRTELLKTTA